MLSGIEQFKRDLVKEISENSTLDSTNIVSVMQSLETVCKRYIVEPMMNELTVGDNGLPREVNEYLDSCSIEGQSNATLKRKRCLYRILFSTVVKPLNDIKVSDIRNFLFSYKRERNVSDRSLETHRSSISGLFEWLANNEYIAKNPVKLVKPIKYEAKERQALSRLELEILRNACRNKYEVALVDFMVSTGCRVNEVCEMRLNDIDFTTREVRVINGKGKKDRTVFISDRAIVSLQEYLKERKGESEYLFVAKVSPFEGLTTCAIRKQINRLANRCKNSISVHVTPHILRHTYATLALNAGMPIEEISESMGHSSIETTMVYAKVSKQRLSIDHQKYVV